MPVDTAKVPAFVGRLPAETDSNRLTVLQRPHPSYKTHYASWMVQLDAFEGRGGFLDGGYLWPYPREDDLSFKERMKMARYHNYLETLVDLYVRFIFTQSVHRSSKNAEYNAWLADVDGTGTAADDFYKRWASLSLVNGHAGVLVDKTADEPQGPTKAQEQARVVLNIFAAPAITDWRYANSDLVGVKLREAGPPPDLATELEADDIQHQQYLLWDEEGWARFNSEGTLIGADLPQLGLVPFVVLRPKQSELSPMLGRALVSNANVVRAHFNRCSEEDEVLRSQAFSVLCVSVPPDGNVDEAKVSLGGVLGTAKALVVKGTIDYKTPDQQVPQTIRDNSAHLVQEMYRSAHVRFNRDSLAAESGEAIRLQYTELNEMLQGFAKALAQGEREVARAWFAWTTTDPAQAQAAFEAAQVVVTYPTEFFLDALINDLQSWDEAIRMQLGDTMTKRIKKKAVRRIDPTIDAKELKVIDAEIDALPTDMLSMGQAGLPLDHGQNPPGGAAPNVNSTSQRDARNQGPMNVN